MAHITEEILGMIGVGDLQKINTQGTVFSAPQGYEALSDKWEGIYRSSTELIEGSVLEVTIPLGVNRNTARSLIDEFGVGAFFFLNLSCVPTNVGILIDDMRFSSAPNSLNDLIAYYPFNGNAIDASGHGNHGDIYGAQSTLDRFGNSNSALYFDGSDKLVVDNPEILPVGEEFTVNVWAKFNSLSRDHTIIDKRTKAGSEDNVVKIMINDQPSPGVLSFTTCDVYHRATSILYSVSKLNKGDWYMITGVYDNNRMSLYINGRLIDDAITSSTLNSTGSNLWIGANDKAGDYNNFEGSLDELRIYSRAFHPEEISRLYKDNNP